MFYKKQKRNQFTLTMSVLVIALVILGITLIRSIPTLVSGATNSESDVEVAANFDYTHDRDQYWYPAMSGETFDYTRDRDQYWQSVSAVAFDYTRDRDQYWYPAMSGETFDYTRDRDQYEYPAVPMSAVFDYTRDRDQYEYPAVPMSTEGLTPAWEVARQRYELSVKGLVPGWAAAQQQ
jgi:hypothetical protein